MSQFGIRAKLCAGKAVLTHPIKLNVLAILCAGSGEVMVILTKVIAPAEEKYQARQMLLDELFKEA